MGHLSSSVLACAHLADLRTSRGWDEDLGYAYERSEVTGAAERSEVTGTVVQSEMTGVAEVTIR